jgi:hypothetical protein
MTPVKNMVEHMEKFHKKKKKKKLITKSKCIIKNFNGKYFICNKNIGHLAKDRINKFL